MSVAPHELGERSYDRDSGSCRRDCGTVTTSTPSSQRAKILRTSRRPDGSSQAQWYVSSRADMPAARLPRPVPTVDVELSCTPALRHAASAASAVEAVTMRRVALTCSTRLPPGKPFTGAGASERRKSEKVHLFPGSTLLILQSRFGRHLHHPRAPDGQCSLVACERYQFSRPRGHFTASGALRQKRRFGMHGLSLAEKGRIFSPSLVTALARNIQRTIWTQRISSETCQYYSPPRPVWRLAGLPVRGRRGQRSELELGSCRAACHSARTRARSPC